MAIQQTILPHSECGSWRGAWGNMKGIDEPAFPQTMEVEYVRVYQKK